MAGVVIIGAGHAGGMASGFLRQYGFDGEITLIGDEPYLPYQRPPLSKAWLKGQAGLEDLYLRSEQFYPDQKVTARLNTRVTSIDPERKVVTTADGDVAYDHLIIATGSKARSFDIPGTQTVPFHLLRTLDDAERIK